MAGEASRLVRQKVPPRPSGLCSWQLCWRRPAVVFRGVGKYRGISKEAEQESEGYTPAFRHPRFSWVLQRRMKLSTHELQVPFFTWTWFAAQCVWGSSQPTEAHENQILCGLGAWLGSELGAMLVLLPNNRTFMQLPLRCAAQQPGEELSVRAVERQPTQGWPFLLSLNDFWAWIALFPQFINQKTQPQSPRACPAEIRQSRSSGWICRCLGRMGGVGGCVSVRASWSPQEQGCIPPALPGLPGAGWGSRPAPGRGCRESS